MTPVAQSGNPLPRVFRLEADRAIINRYGFNSLGCEAVRKNLEQRRKKKGRHTEEGIVGINLGKNKESKDAVADYLIGIEKLAEFADYLVVNVSSPNTPVSRTSKQTT